MTDKNKQPKEWKPLSEKVRAIGTGITPQVSVEDVKEAVEKLKPAINDYWTNMEGTCICPECWEHREGDEKRTKECMFTHIFKVIDKIFGNFGEEKQ